MYLKSCDIFNSLLFPFYFCILFIFIYCSSFFLFFILPVYNGLANSSSSTSHSSIIQWKYLYYPTSHLSLFCNSSLFHSLLALISPLLFTSILSSTIFFTLSSPLLSCHLSSNSTGIGLRILRIQELEWKGQRCTPQEHCWEGREIMPLDHVER